MARLGPLLLKGAGVVVLALLVLSVIATVVSIVFSIVATIIAAVVTLAILAVLVAAAIGLASLLWGADEQEFDTATSTPHSADDRSAHLREQYLEGTLSDAEFERELDRVFEDDPADTDEFETGISSDETRLRDR